MPAARELLEEHRLVGEDVRGIAVEVVDREEVVVEEAGGPAHGNTCAAPTHST